MAWYKATLSPLLKHLRYYSLALNHRYGLSLVNSKYDVFCTFTLRQVRCSDYVSKTHQINACPCDIWSMPQGPPAILSKSPMFSFCARCPENIWIRVPSTFHPDDHYLDTSVIRCPHLSWKVSRDPIDRQSAGLPQYRWFSAGLQ